jgi:hypothetical protein
MSLPTSTAVIAQCSRHLYSQDTPTSSSSVRGISICWLLPSRLSSLNGSTFYSQQLWMQQPQTKIANSLVNGSCDPICSRRDSQTALLISCRTRFSHGLWRDICSSARQNYMTDRQYPLATETEYRPSSVIFCARHRLAPGLHY